jgi:hypothetical protein
MKLHILIGAALNFLCFCVQSQDTLSHFEKNIQYLDNEFHVCPKDSAVYERYAIYCPSGKYLYVDHTDYVLIRNDCSMAEFDEGIKLLVDGEIIFYEKKNKFYEIDLYKGGYLQATKFYRRNRLRDEIIYDYRNNVNGCSCSINSYDRKGVQEYGNWSFTGE